MKYQPIIGLEVHVELKTKSKMFCGCSADYFGKEPNTHVCPTCLGLPGALPVPNKTAIEWCVMIGLALNCKIPLFSKFDRKNYFYPDLPKGYQISQYDLPFATNGKAVIARSETKKHSPSKEIATLTPFARNDNKKTIRIRRVHMEEDTGKLLHTEVNGEKVSLIDFNRSGVPLVEIVTEPDFESTTEVVEYLKKLQQIVRYLDLSNADMEKGQMRLEPNISLRKGNTTNNINKQILPIYKVEVKNINSFRFVEKAIKYEILRQKKILESGKTPVQETRGWDEKKQVTFSQRLKEESMDYRYFPEPDIPPLHWRKSQIRQLESQLPELPDIKILRFQKEYGLSEYDSEILTRDKEVAEYFEEAVKTNNESSIRSPGLTPKGIMNQNALDIKIIANWIVNQKIDIKNVLPASLIQDINKSKQTTVTDTEELEKIVKEILDENPKAVEDYKGGKAQVIGFLIGKVKQANKQPLDTRQIKKILEKYLKN